MSTTTAPSRGTSPDFSPGFRPGPLGRLGLWVTKHAKLVTGVWLLLIIGLGAFAPQVEHNLSGAGWQADGLRRASAATPPPPSRSSCTPPTDPSPKAPAPRSSPR
jgi:RND superfamily putative drug exporter